MTEDFFGDGKTYSPAGTDQEVRFIVDVLGLPAGAAVLDLYCGYGRHAIELAKQGYRVTGVDATEAFLAIARQKAAEEKADLNFRQLDMRDLNYSEEFDAVINMFAAFGYFSDDENAAVLRKVAVALRPGGLFLIDLLNRDWMVRNSLNRYWRHPSGEYVLSYKIELRAGVAMMKRMLLNQVTGAKTQYDFVLRAYSLSELTTLLANCGLTVKAAYGGFDGRPFGDDTPRMIILAEK
ncbi:MAG TPA: class I SAM-dependent methyltransferase [Negativicutes bacterium]|nr:class I SAM-dependent methyltransferase [Negativicutes bacterium]